MLKYFVFNLYLVLLAWQVLGDEPADSPNEIDDYEDDFGNQDLDDADGSYFGPQPRLIQVRANGKAYTVSFMPVNWHTARELCAAQNQVLASINSTPENEAVVQALIDKGYYSYDATYWIGGSQLGHIGQWSWVSTGLPLLYANWRNNPQASHNCDRNCLEITNKGLWNGNDCNLSRGFICEDLPRCR